MELAPFSTAHMAQNLVQLGQAAGGGAIRGRVDRSSLIIGGGSGKKNNARLRGVTAGIAGAA